MYLKVTAKPGSKKDLVVEENGRYVISTREPAEEGRANEAVKTLLAAHLGVPTNKISLLRGADKPSKLFLKRE